MVIESIWVGQAAVTQSVELFLVRSFALVPRLIASFGEADEYGKSKRGMIAHETAKTYILQTSARWPILKGLFRCSFKHFRHKNKQFR